MVYPIDKLIQQCGWQTAIDILPGLFIKINSASAVEKASILEYDYEGHFNILYYSFINTSIQEYIQKTSKNNKHLLETLIDLKAIMALFYDCRNSIDVAEVDYIVISYLGDFQLRFKNTMSTNKPSGTALYLDIQSLRIALIDENTMQIWRRNYMVFKNGVKVISGYFVLKYVLNYFGIDYYNWRGLIGI